MTYSASTAVRAALLVAGFQVAKGRGIAGRVETTVAWTQGDGGGRAELLGGDWLLRWSRSGAKFPGWVGAGEEAAFEAAIRGHPQFQTRA